MVNDTIGTNSDVPSKSYIRQNYRIIINFTIRLRGRSSWGCGKDCRR